MHEPVKPTGALIAICALILIGGALSLARSVGEHANLWG